MGTDVYSQVVVGVPAHTLLKCNVDTELVTRYNPTTGEPRQVNGIAYRITVDGKTYGSGRKYDVVFDVERHLMREYGLGLFRPGYQEWVREEAIIGLEVFTDSDGYVFELPSEEAILDAKWRVKEAIKLDALAYVMTRISY